VGFRSELVYLMGLGDLTGLGPDSEVRPTGHIMTVRVGRAPRARPRRPRPPRDGKGPLAPGETAEYPVYASPRIRSSVAA